MAETGRLTRAAPRRSLEPGDAAARRDHRWRCWRSGKRSRAPACSIATSCPRCSRSAARSSNCCRHGDYYLQPRRHRRRDRHRRSLIGGALGPRGRHPARRQPLPRRKPTKPISIISGPTPKIIFFPVMIMWFGVGPGSKVAMGTLSCFFPVALSVAAGMRADRQGADPRRPAASAPRTWQMVTKIYLPAMRHPIINGVRLGLGVAHHRHAAGRDQALEPAASAF